MEWPVNPTGDDSQKNWEYLGGLLYRGKGSPEGVVRAPIGAHYQRSDGAAGTCFYVKEGAEGAPTGWVAK